MAGSQGHAGVHEWSTPLGVEHIQELLRVHLLAGGEHDDLKQGGAALQEGVQVLTAVQCAVHQRLIEVQHL